MRNGKDARCFNLVPFREERDKRSEAEGGRTGLRTETKSARVILSLHPRRLTANRTVRDTTMADKKILGIR